MCCPSMLLLPVSLTRLSNSRVFHTVLSLKHSLVPAISVLPDSLTKWKGERGTAQGTELNRIFLLRGLTFYCDQVWLIYKCPAHKKKNLKGYKSIIYYLYDIVCSFLLLLLCSTLKKYVVQHIVLYYSCSRLS